MFSCISRYSLVGLLSFLLALSACGGDDTGGNNANNGNNGGQDAGMTDTTDDTSNEDDTGTEDAGAEDTSTVDATDSTGGEDTLVDDTGAEDTSTEDVDDDGSTMGDASDTADDVDTRGACGAGTDQTCAFPASSSTCAQGDWGAGSFVETFTLEDNGDCCYDLDADGNLDSGLARLKPIIQQLTGFEFNEIIRVQIESGALTYLFTYRDWINPVNDSDSQLDVVFGNSNSTWTEKQNDNGVFTVTADSVDANGDPISQLEPADVCDSHLSIRGGEAPLRVPIGAELIEVTLRDVRVDADVVAPTDLSAGGKVGLENGEMGGWITLEDVFTGLNGVAQACECLQKDVFALENDSWTCTSTDADRQACENDPNASSFCVDFLSRPPECGLAAQVVVNNADYDGLPEGNPDGTIDSYTIGANFTATGAEITGTQ